MGKSNLSFVIQTPTHQARNQQTGIPKSSSPSKKEHVTFEAEYQSCVELLSKTLSAIVEKEGGSKARRQFQKTHKTTSVLFGKASSKVSQASNLKRTSGISKEKQLKTESSCPQLSKRQKILNDIGDISSLNCDDQIINNLISNIKTEEETLVDLVLRKSETDVRDKMKNYMARQT